MAWWTRCRRSSLTGVVPLRTLETVPIDTLACLATSRMVGRLSFNLRSADVNDRISRFLRPRVNGTIGCEFPE